jgi:ribosomal protein S21
MEHRFVDDSHYFKPFGVKVINGNIDLALKKFKSLMKDSKHIIQVKEHQVYIKPSVVKREKKAKILFKKQQINKQNK